jgi:hypothetical protein
LIVVEIEVGRDEILSLVDGRRNGAPHGREARYAWDTLGEALELDDQELQDLREDSQGLIEQAIDSRKTRTQLAANDYLWIVYEDSFPHDAVTWIYVGAETVQVQ